MNNTEDEIIELEKIVSDSFNQEALSDKDSAFFIKKAQWHISNARNVIDYAKAFKYAKKAIKLGYVEGYYILGQLYYYGTGCEQNLVRALDYFEKFVNYSDTNNTMNQDALEDSLFRLCEGLYKLKKYNKALYYYHKLQFLDPLMAEALGEFEEEIAGINKEKDIKLLKNSLTFVLVCCGVLFIATNYQSYIRNFFATKIDSKGAIVDNRDRKEDTSSEVFYFSDDIAPAQELKNFQEGFELIDEKRFYSLNLKDIYATNAWASTEYVSAKGTDYSILCAIDGDESTSYQEGAAGSGIGESIHFDFSDNIELKGIVLLNGKSITKDDYYNNNRLASFVIKGEKDITVKVEDKLGKQYIFFEEPLKGASFDIVFESVFEGLIYDDTCITDIWFFE